MKRHGSPMLNNGEAKKRATTRTTAGKPNRFGVNDTSIPNAASLSNNLNPPLERPSRRGSVPTNSTGQSIRSSLTNRTTRSVSSTVRQCEIDLLTEEEIDKLQEEYEVHEREVEQLEFSVKSIVDNVEALTLQLQQIPNQEEQVAVDLKQQIYKEQTTLRDQQNDVTKRRIDLKFEYKALERKKAQLRRTADFQKQVVAEEEEDNDDNLSQNLSQSEEEQDDVFGGNKDLVGVRGTEEVTADPDRQEKELTDQRAFLLNQLVDRTKAAEAALQREKVAVGNTDQRDNLDDDELLIRLRRLQEPSAASNPTQVQRQETINRNQSTESMPPSTLTSEALSDQFAQVLTKAFDKLGSTSNNTDKFLARQVQGKDLPVFTGQPEEWSTFYTAFENSTLGCGFSHMDNLPRLQKCLKGEALKTIQCLLVRPENVPAIIKKLKMRFGRPEHIVQTLINKAKEVPAFKEDRLDLLIDFGLAVDNLVETIKALKCWEHLSSPQLLEEFSKKLPVSMRTKWIEYVTDNSCRKENLETFSFWMSIQTDIACKLCPPRLKEEGHQRKPWEDKRQRRREEKVWAMATSEPDSKHNKFNFKTRNCLFCDKAGHPVFQCRLFEKQNLEDRWKFVKSKNLCFCCLKYGHSSRDCRGKKDCGKNECKIPHHPLLHKDVQPNKPNMPHKSSGGETLGHAAGVTENQNHINLMILPVSLRGPKGTIKTFAMLDPGATCSVIDDDIATHLGLEGEIQPFIHSGLHPQMVEKGSRSVILQIISSNGEKQFDLSNVRTKKNFNLPRQFVRKSVLRKWNHLRHLSIECYEQGKPTILIGLDNYQISNTLELIPGSGNAPGAGRTELGWVLLGDLRESSRTDFCGMVFDRPDDDLHQLVKQHFTTEDFGVKVVNIKQRSKEDVLAQQIMDSTIKRRGNYWESGLLWKSEDVVLPSSKNLAMSRLMQMERRMDRNSTFAEQYLSKIREYEEKGFARKLTIKEASVENDRTFYLPHFMATNPKKPGKLRFVFDAAAKLDGVSLNDNLLKGPDKLTCLPAVLLKFRQRVIGLTADIKDMFHMVKIRKEDAGAQRFLFRGMDRDRNPDIFEMGVLIFGAACSPACAQEVKNLNAQEFQQQYPDGAKAIINYHYVDDYLDSVDNLQQATKIFQEVREIHLKGGFNICNWISNDKKLLEFIPQDLHAPSAKNMDLEGATERVLGLFWKPEADYFTFSITYLKMHKDLQQQARLPTKRELLALVMSIYDPLGFLSLFTVKAKIILQETWRTGIGWDDELPHTLQDKWVKWNEELLQIETFQLPRCYGANFSTADNVQLHVFGDASEQAFGAVAYFRIQKGDQITVSLIMSKARVAPTKPLTIPRLELQAAVLGTRLASFIKSEHDVNVHQTVYWSDSQTVISWIKNEGKRFTQFVSSRLGEIQENTEATEWRWLSTKLNVADEMTRDGKPCDWSLNSRWINGPEFLRLKEQDWPISTHPVKETSEDDPECKKQVICFTVEESLLIDVNRFSKYNRAVRSIAYVFRFIRNCRFPDKRTKIMELTPEEIVKAEQWWWRYAQGESFPEEMKCLQKGKLLPSNSKIINCNVFLDEENIARVQGRLDNADLPAYTKRPVLLSPKHKLTQLLIAKYHEQNGHHGQETVINEIRQRFHIPQVRAAVRRAWMFCQACKNSRAQPIVPQMGQLPAMRLESHVMPFTNTGLDYFGPINVTIGRRNEKRWVSLFTCLSTRAIHLELVSSLNTDSCIMALRRFVARRGNPTNIYSDQGTNFIGSNNELKKALEEFNQQVMANECTSRGINWHFIPPHAPHMGGSWERMVKSVKIALNAVLKERNPKEEVLRTLLAEAESIVNRHPLTHVPVDPQDPEALTPNHFLIGRSSSNQLPGHFVDSDLWGRKQWRQSQELANRFWNRWVREYLPSLLRRTKWFMQQEPIKLGDIVLVVDNQLSRNSWPMGRVIQLYPGKDGQIRVVDVKTSSGIYKRAVAKLCKLDVIQTGPAMDSSTGSGIEKEDQKGSDNLV